jgi:hypothetical protein
VDDAAIPPDFVDATIAIDANASARSIHSSAAISLSGATLTLDSITAPELSITSNAELTTYPATATETHKLELEIDGALTVDATSWIHVDEKGYLPGRTKGNTTVGAATGNSGGSYAGWGTGTDTNDVYGDYTNPDEFGSGGAAGGPLAAGSFGSTPQSLSWTADCGHKAEVAAANWEVREAVFA